MHAPCKIHRKAVNRVLAYLKGCPGKRLLFPSSMVWIVKVYTDTDFGGSIVDFRSTTDYCTFIVDNLVSWKSSKHDKVSRSSTEPEYQTLADGASEGQWIYEILSDLRDEYADPIHFFYDNKSAIALAKNPGLQGKIKHMERDSMFFKERMHEGIFDLEFVSFADQATDVLTKGLSKSLLQSVVSKLGMDDIHTLLAGGCQ